jgi:hypothetical protein
MNKGKESKDRSKTAAHASGAQQFLQSIITNERANKIVFGRFSACFFGVVERE